jgi:hypothetical protein
VAEKLDVKVTGKSIHEVAHEMAVEILTTVENRRWGSFNRKEYLQAHYDALMTLHGNEPR